MKVQILAWLSAAVLSVPTPSWAQQGAAPEPRQPSVSPGGAFVRAMIVPGWGHASLRSYNRAGFYFTMESLTAYTLLRTRNRLSDARTRLAFRERIARADLEGQGVIDPDEIDDALAADATISDLRGLVGAREQQQEDLVAFGIFLILLSGIDAYVSGHLADFPTPIELEARPSQGGRSELAVRVKLGG